MKQKVQEIKTLTNTGSATSNISVAVDGRYNSLTIASAKKPGQAASQAMAVACETQTPHQYIVSAVLQNKLGWTGAWLKNKRLEVTCPGGHEGCTANIPKPAPLSEHEMGKSIGTDLALQGALVKYATTDRDGKAALGIDESTCTRILQPLWEVERLADPHHLSRSQFRQCNTATFSADMFPGRTKLQKKQALTIFSQDVKARSSLILKELLGDCCGDLQVLKKVACRKCYKQQSCVTEETAPNVDHTLLCATEELQTVGGHALCTLQHTESHHSA